MKRQSRTSKPGAWRIGWLTFSESMFLVVMVLFVPDPSSAQEVLPVLEFPEQGLDDAAAYMGYKTRFFWDSERNAFQIYMKQQLGRVVHVWANAANESVGFTMRDTSGHPALLTWGSAGAVVTSSRQGRSVEYVLRSETSPLVIGLVLLGSMRVERDFQYQQGHLLSLGEEPFVQKELVELVENLERLPEVERDGHLALLGVTNVRELQSRLHPTMIPETNETSRSVCVEQVSFDGKNKLSLEISVDSRTTSLELLGKSIFVQSDEHRPIDLRLKITTDSPALTHLSRGEIFNKDFQEFYERAKADHDSLLRMSAPQRGGSVDEERLQRFRRLDRQVRSAELLSYREKLMAGLPNFATYFGRDMMMTALMMEAIWSPSMLEHVIASVLRKLAPSGEVSHEEALGGQAIRENAAEYNKLMAEHIRRQEDEDYPGADSLIGHAREILANLQFVRENYNMVDDDFQLSVLVARYLENSHVSPDRKRTFLLESSTDGRNVPRVTLLLRNLAYMLNLVSSYGDHPEAFNLVSFPRTDDQRWFPGSWRDSRVGYANGRYAMDINVIWAPQALESMESIFNVLTQIGFTVEALASLVPEIHGTMLMEYARNPESLHQLIKIWKDSVRHFEVRLSSEEMQKRLQSKLHWLSESERKHWTAVVATTAMDQEDLEFLALSLDADGRPIPVVNTDPAALLFLEDFTERILSGEADPEQVMKIVNVFLEPYPVGLFVQGLGPLVANDTYALQDVWENYEKDQYHSPRTVWGREVNLLLLGIAKQILTGIDSSGKLKNPNLGPYIKELASALNKTISAVEASGLKHSELWSYRIEDGKLFPVRYGSTSDIQLWNLTDLAVQFMLVRIPKL